MDRTMPVIVLTIGIHLGFVNDFSSSLRLVLIHLNGRLKRLQIAGQL
jgi:hypothetical protein